VPVPQREERVRERGKGGAIVMSITVGAFKDTPHKQHIDGGNARVMQLFMSITGRA
jgi:hypothetical protein